MDTKLSMFVALVACPRCAGRNSVDVRKSLRRRSRCGRCGEPLPVRVPVPVIVAAGTLLIVVLGIVYVLLGAWTSHEEKGARETIAALLRDGDPGEAVHLLESPRTPSSDSGKLATEVARALAAPVLDADRDPSLGRAALDQAIERSDALVQRYGAALPELLAVLDMPVQRLQARLGARDLLAGADKLASAADPSPDAVERAIANARLAAAEAPGDVAGAVDALSVEIRAHAAVVHARQLMGKRPEDAQALVRSVAAGIALPEVESASTDAEPPKDIASRVMLDQLAAIRKAISDRDAAALRGLVRLRPQAGWAASAEDEFDGEIARACHALGSLEADAARAAFDPAQRSEHLLAAMTCDEILPPDFLVAGRMALADAFVDAARRGGPLRPALGAWSSIDRPERDRALASIGCLAEAREDWSSAVAAWGLIESRAALRLMADCRLEAREEAVPLPVPSLDYPSLPTGG